MMHCLLLLLLLAQSTVSYSPEQAYTVTRRYGWNTSTFNRTPIRFGTAITLEAGRDYYTLSKYMSNAWEIYFHWLNKVQGGIIVNGLIHPVELVLINDDSDKSQVTWATQRLVDVYGVKFLFGPYSSGLTREAAKVANASGATVLASGAASSSVYRDRPQVFGTSTPGDQWVAPAIEMFAQMANPPKRIAFLQEDVGFTKFTCSPLASLTAQHNMTIVHSVTVTKTAGYPEILEAVKELAAADPDVVFSCNYNIVCKRLIEASRELNFNPKAFVLTTCVPGVDFIADLQRTGLHVMGTAAWSETLASTSVLTNLTAREFYDMYYARYNEPPHYLSAAAFSAGATFVHAIQSSNSIDPKTVADTLRVMDVQTLYGQISFNDVGLCKNKMKIVTWQQESQVTVVAPANVALSPAVYPKPTWLELRCLDPTSELTIWGYDEQGASCAECAPNTASSFVVSKGKRICSACPKGRSLVRTSGDLATCATCRNGTFWCGPGWLSPRYASYMPWKTTEAYICGDNTSTSQCLECPAGRYTDQRGLTLCKECQPGRFQSIPGKVSCSSCQNWDKRKHPDAFSAANASTTCKPCPKGAVCELDSKGLRSGYSNADGYFLLEKPDYSSEFPLGRLYQCPHGDGEACLANKRCYVDPTSDEVSMEGPFCGTCKAGFSKGESDHLCKKCGSTGKSWGYAFSIQALLFMVCSCLFLSQVIKHPQAMLGKHHIIFRQLLNYIHLSVAVFPVVEVSDAGNRFISAIGVLQYMSAARSPVAISRGAECYANDLFPGMDIFKAWVVSGLCMVPCWLLFDISIFFIVRTFCRCREWPVPSYNKLVLGMTFNAFIVQPRLTQLFLMPFDCMYMDQIRLLSDTSFICDTSEIHSWQMLGAVGLLCFSFGIPLALAAVLHIHRRNNTLHSLECMERYRFFFQGCKPEFYYFESVNMLRKVVFHIAAFIPWLSPGNEDENTQKALTSVSLLLLTMLSLALHQRCRPYDFREFYILHKIEAAMLWAFLMTCLLQTFVYMSSQAWVFSEASKNHERNKNLRDSCCSAVVIYFHLRFFLYVLFGIFGTSIRRNRLYQRFIAVGAEVKFSQNSMGDNIGLTVGHLDDASRVYLAETFGALAGKQLRHDYFGYREFNDLLRRAAVEAFYHKDRERFMYSIPWLQRKIHKKVMMLPDGLRQRTAVRGIEDRIRRSPTYAMEGNAPWRTDPYYSFGFDSETHYEKDHLQQAMNETYSIEDLQMAVLQILWMERVKVDKKSVTVAITDFVASVFHERSDSFDEDAKPMESASKAHTPSYEVGRAAFVNSQVEAPVSYAEQIAELERERESLRKALRAKDAELLELEGPDTQASGDSDSEEAKSA